MRNHVLKIAVSAALLAAPLLASAHIAVPPLQPASSAKNQQSAGSYLPPKTPSSASTPSVPAPKPLTSAQIWQKAIATPPEGKISMRSKRAAEKTLVAAYEAGKTQDLPPIAGTNGEVIFAYGQSLPTLVTAPMHTSLVLLRAGMTAPHIVGLNPAYWSVQTLMAGNRPELAITPRFKGLHGNLVVTGASPHGKPMNYVIEVTSDANRYTPMIGFYYPGAFVRTWKNDAATTEAFTKKVNAETVAALPTIDAADLDFRWKMHCAGGGWFSNSDCGSIEPERVFDDGKQTFIQFTPGQGSHGGIPSILAENAAGQNAIINTQFRDGYYIVDGVPHKVLLIAGKGSSGKVVKLIHESN
jgi:type IV secretion system protein VirB9